jgi:hypothetical protein
MTGCGLQITGSDLTGINPLLSPLVDPLATFLTPLAGSPVIDAGNPAGCTDGTNPLTSDQNGTPRPLDGNGDGIPVCDIGAIEYKVVIFLPMVIR